MRVLHLFARAYGWSNDDLQSLTMGELNYLKMLLVEEARKKRGR